MIYSRTISERGYWVFRYSTTTDEITTIKVNKPPPSLANDWVYVSSCPFYFSSSDSSLKDTSINYGLSPLDLHNMPQQYSNNPVTKTIDPDLKWLEDYNRHWKEYELKTQAYKQKSCECGGEKANTTHSTWCPVYGV